MEDPQAAVQIFEMEQALEVSDDVSAAASVAAETLSDRDEFDALAQGQEFLGKLSDLIPQPDRAHPVDFEKSAEPEADEGGYTLLDIFAPATPQEREREDLFAALQKSPAYRAARAQFVRSAQTPSLNFKKLRSVEQLKDWVRSMLGQGHSLESLVERAKSGGDLRAASYIRDAGEEILTGV